MELKKQDIIWRKWLNRAAFFRFFYGIVILMGCLWQSVYLLPDGRITGMPFSVQAEEINDYELYGAAAVLMDGETKRILYGKNEDTFLSNASTTKILTCILVLENCDLSEYAKVSKLAASQPDVQADLGEGEYYQVGDLLHSLMLESHNDSAYVLAEHVAGSVEAFSLKMNEKAREIGCVNSYFITPNGLDATNEATGKTHGTCAKDLALIMRYCVLESEKKDAFIEITQTGNYSFHSYSVNDKGEYVKGSRVVDCRNHNSLFQMMDGVISGKTGFTNKAGYCYVGAVKDGEKTYVISVLGAGWPPNKTFKWKDALKLIGYGKTAFERKELFFGEEVLEQIEIENGIPKENSFEAKAYCYPVCSKETEYYLVKEEEELKTIVSCLPKKDTETKKGEKLGTISYYLGNELIKKLPILSQNAISLKNHKWAVTTIWNLFVEEFYLFSDN